jgi:hypothetical protein
VLSRHSVVIIILPRLPARETRLARLLKKRVRRAFYKVTRVAAILCAQATAKAGSQIEICSTGVLRPAGGHCKKLTWSYRGLGCGAATHSFGAGKQRLVVAHEDQQIKMPTPTKQIDVRFFIRPRAARYSSPLAASFLLSALALARGSVNVNLETQWYLLIKHASFTIDAAPPLVLLVGLEQPTSAKRKNGGLSKTASRQYEAASESCSGLSRCGLRQG